MRAYKWESLLGALTLGATLLGAGCNNNPQLSSPPTVSMTSTPEEAWDTYKSGWRTADLDKVLSACAQTTRAQDRCRRQFVAVQAKGGLQTISNVLEAGSLIFGREIDGVRYYTLSADGKGTPVKFSFSSDVGWKMEEF